MRSVLGMLYEELKDQYATVQVHGDTSPKERNEIFRSFEQDTVPRIILADPGTMAHGVTLVAATTIVWFAPIDRTELYLQANKRIHRPGQTKSCVVVQLAATAIEREIYRRLESNETLQGLLLKLVQEG